VSDCISNENIIIILLFKIKLHAIYYKEAPSTKKHRNPMKVTCKISLKVAQTWICST